MVDLRRSIAYVPRQDLTPNLRNGKSMSQVITPEEALVYLMVLVSAAANKRRLNLVSKSWLAAPSRK